MSLRKPLFAILAQVPLATGIVAWPEYFLSHYKIAVPLVIFYEFFWFVVGFGKKVWDKIEAKLVQTTADWIVNAANNIAPNFRRRYYRQVVREHGIFTVSGLGLIQTYRLRLEQVFVDLRIDSTNPQGFNIDPIKQKELAGSRPVWSFLASSDKNVPAATTLVIVGPPGSGKTTLLKHMALSLATSRDRRTQVSSSIPILLYLRDHIQTILKDRPSLGSLTQDYFANANQFATLKPPSHWFPYQLEHGRCFVMLDGLDEVADPNERLAASKWVDAQIRNYPDCKFVLTARPQGYLDAPLELADMVLEVQPFSAKQVRKFIENWYLANEIISSRDQPQGSIQQRAAEGARNLLLRLRDVSSLSALTVNPLLLTMIAMVHRYRGALPRSRVELYEEICEVLLERWRQSRNIPDRLRLNAKQKLVVLRPLAAYMMQNEIRDISTEEAIEVIASPLERVGTASLEAVSFLREQQNSSGLLLERERNKWSFAHLTFQEYLTSVHWLEEPNTTRDWNRMIRESWWHETLRLYAAQADATGLVEACLEANTIAALTLAADLLDESRELSPKVRAQVEEILIAGLVSRNAFRRRLAAEVHLSRRLRTFQLIDNLRTIDPSFITCAEYQLFLDEMQAQDKYFQPPHWESLSFPRDEALKPISGIGGEDAIAFCEWLTLRHGGTASYRLPTLDEASSSPSTCTTLATWCQEEQTLMMAEPKDDRISSAVMRQLDSKNGLSRPRSLPSRPSVKNEYGANLGSFPGRISILVANASHLALRANLSDSVRPLNANQLSRFIRSAVDFKLYNSLLAARDLTIELVLSIDGSLPLPSIMDFTSLDKTLLDRVADRERERKTFLAKDLDQVHEINRYRYLDLGFAVNLVSAIQTDLKQAQRIADDIGSAVEGNSRSVVVLILAVELAEVIALNLSLVHVILAIDSHDQPRVQKIARLIPKSDELTQYWPTDRQAEQEDHDLQRRRLEIRDSLAGALENVYAGLRQIEDESFALSWVRRLRLVSFWGSHRRHKLPDIHGLEKYLWWLRVVSARQRGVLPSWEGLRVVRHEIDLTSREGIQN